jgi:hypothetical protein
MLKSLALFLLLQAAVTDEAARPPRPDMATTLSPTAMFLFAVDELCLPAVVADRPLSPGRRPGVSPITEGGIPGYLMLGRGRVVLRQTARNSCYVRVGDGDAAGMRQRLLDDLTARGHAPRLVVAREVRGAAGRFRQERYCLSFAGRPGGMLLTTALGRGGHRVQATLIPSLPGCAADDPPAAEAATWTPINGR